MGADAGIGGTYAVMPELFLRANQLVTAGKFQEAGQIQSDINDIIIALCSLKGAMYAGIKEILRLRGVNIGSVRAPLEAVAAEDAGPIQEIMSRIDLAIEKYCG